MRPCLRCRKWKWAPRSECRPRCNPSSSWSRSTKSAYPYLAQKLGAAAQPLHVLDTCAGTGRDATWIADHGHIMVAVDPSQSMLKVAQNFHAESNVAWVQDRLPDLSATALANASFDMNLLNAVWMYIAPQDRDAALARIKSLLRPSGSVFATIRLGPVNEERGAYHISASDFVVDAQAAGFTVVPRGDYPRPARPTPSELEGIRTHTPRRPR